MARLDAYHKKRHFNRTPEPTGEQDEVVPAGRRFLVQKHAASRLHYDFRLELDGVLKSWAVPKGPSLDPKVKSLAVHVEDHPLSYASFEGVIPPGEYGGGTVMLWDRGSWQPEGDPRKGYREGKLKFELHGEKLKGRWTLVRLRGRDKDGDRNWLLMKSADAYARPSSQYDVLKKKPRSVASKRTMDEIAAAADRVWSSNGKAQRTSLAKTKAKSKARSKAKRITKKSVKETAKRPIEETTAAVAELTGARRAAMPSSFKPQLATAAAQTPRGEGWLHELKLDGYRMLCRIEKGTAKLITRRGKDWSDRFPAVIEAAAKLGWNDAILDGEVVMLNPDGTTDFQALQNSMNRGRASDVVYFVFDLPYFAGYDLTRTPLIERKELLARLLENQPSEGRLRYSGHIDAPGEQVFVHACQHALEGLVSKRADSHYQQQRTTDWIKSKCMNRQEFVIGGWTDPSGSRHGFGALLLGYFEDGKLKYCGRVGTGFTSQSLADVLAQLKRRSTNQSPFDNPPTGRQARDVHWVEPTLVAEIQFGGWTEDGILRQASFQGLREDKPATAVTREEPQLTGKRTRSKSSAENGSSNKSSRSKSARSKHTGRDKSDSSNGKQASRNLSAAKPAGRQTAIEKPSGRKPSVSVVAGVRLTNPSRILYAEQGITKRDLALYYETIAQWILPHIVNRPLTLVRCPEGYKGSCFYQKHLTDSMPDAVRGVEIQEKDERRIYVVIDDLAGLISLVQMSILELHPWPARADRLERPDLLVFDLDPGEGVAWKAVVQGARDVRERLQAHGLQSYLRTSGGKGLHVVVPLSPRRNTWDEAKYFARTIADRLTAEFPDRYIATASKARRRGKIFIDYLRNQRGATSVASYSTRARQGAPVATPVTWDELTASLKPNKYNIKNLPRRLASLSKDPWEGFFDVKQNIPKAN